MSHLTPVPSDPDQFRAWLDAMENRPIGLPPAPSEAAALTIKVTLKDVDPPVWRRLVVPGDITLDRLHDVLQAAMGWTDSHLHRFFLSDAPDADYFVTEYDVEEGDDGTPEADVRLDQVLREPGDPIRYDYDFGDGWTHDVRLEDVGELGDDTRLRCTGGERACPPEDVGGVWGYGEVAAWVRGGCRADALPVQFESREDALRWLPPQWDPDAFDLEDTDLRVRAVVASDELLQRLCPGALDAVSRLSPETAPVVSTWLAAAAATSLSAKDVEKLAAPYRTLLAVLGGGAELTGSGYLRPHLVQELCPALGIDPILAGKANRESNVRPLLMFRKAAQHGGLLHTSGGLLTPTVAGIRYRDDPAGLWAHVASRLPAGRSELKRDVGWFTLVALAGGVGHSDIYDAVHQLCVDAGWAEEDGTPIKYYVVNELVWPTLAALAGPRWNSRREWPSWVPAAAATVIFSDDP